MILLPNGCSASDPSVIPANWKTCKASALNKAWRIQYYFRDPAFKEKYPYGKLVAVKGMNHFKTLEDRREAVKAILDNEIYMLQVEGFNPITKTYNGPDRDLLGGISPSTLLPDALEIAYNNLDVSPKTKQDVKNVKDHFIDSVRALRLDGFRVGDLRRSQVRAALDHLGESKSYSNNRYNKARAYISMLFKELLSRDAIEVNPIQGIPKKRTVKRIREVLSEEDLKKVKKHLQKKYPSFYRYMILFFHSGARSSELLSLRREDVDLKQQIFKITVKKGRSYTEEVRAINNNALKLWSELLEEASPGDYLFSVGLVPGPVKIDPWQISKRWREHVKVKLKINADFYSLKHLHTTRVIEGYTRDLAAAVNGHKSKAMNDKHYDVLKRERELEAAKNIDIEL